MINEQGDGEMSNPQCQWRAEKGSVSRWQLFVLSNIAAFWKSACKSNHWNTILIRVHTGGVCAHGRGVCASLIITVGLKTAV
jgi:hypothetical protein